MPGAVLLPLAIVTRIPPAASSRINDGMRKTPTTQLAKAQTVRLLSRYPRIEMEESWAEARLEQSEPLVYC